MVLKRFWAVIIAGSIPYLMGLLAAGRLYSIAHVVYGKQNDPLDVAEAMGSIMLLNTGWTMRVAEFVVAPP